jgi:UDP-3-O-[3-hydroxymyristoyl] glucosamine N-acyltransferase
MKFSLAEIASIVNGTITGNPNEEVRTFAKIEEASEGSLSFLSNPKYENFLYSTEATAVLVSKDFTPKSEVKSNLISVDDPYVALSTLMQLYQNASAAPKALIEEFAHIDNQAVIGIDVYVGAFAYVSEKVIIGKNSQILPHVFIGKNVTIGNNCVLMSGAKIYQDTIIGDNCTIHAGAVIGSDGFGFAPKADGTYETIPQLGNVILGNFVNIGSNTTIDRATMGSTRIANGVKIDNLVQIGHNVEIGENTVIAAQTGISGSTKIGRNCMVAGQVGFAGHISIADGTKIGGQSAVTKSINKPNGSYAGRPLLPVKEYLKMLVNLKNLG